MLVGVGGICVGVGDIGVVAGGIDVAVGKGVETAVAAATVGVGVFCG